MAIQIHFDTAGVPEKPTLVLAYRNGDKIGAIEAEEFKVLDALQNPVEMSFVTKKSLDKRKNVYWDEIKDFRLIWCPEYDLWLEIYVDVNESSETTKTVTAKQLAQAELSQTKLFGMEINTETDIARDDYELPTVLYRADRPEASLIHRVLEKAPHYSIRHVDGTIQNIQRTFTFDNVSIVDALTQIATEMECLVVYHSGTDKNGKVERAISLYDLQSNCTNPACHYRGEFTGVCPKCGCAEINEGYGEDTTIFVTADELADALSMTCNRDETKNCFKLQGGDDLMTATIRNCNPNGSDYIWYLPDAQRKDMSPELRKRLSSYDTVYNRYVEEYEVSVPLYGKYAELIRKYKTYPGVEMLELPKNGYSALTEAIYHAVDMELFLRSGLMPVVEVSDTTAQIQALLLNTRNLSPVSVADVSKISLATANNAVLSMAKTIVDSRYKIRVESSALNGTTWVGKFTVTNYSNEDDTFTTGSVNVAVNDDYTNFVAQKISKLLADGDDKDYSVSGIFKLEYDEFCQEIRKYGLVPLTNIRDMAQTCINMLVEQGVASGETWGKDLYQTLYQPRYDQLLAVEAELSVRQSEVNLVAGVYDEDGTLIQEGFTTQLEDLRRKIQKELDFEGYLGDALWLEFCAYRREDLYQNSNYVSDGLSNAELIDRAEAFFETARKDIVSSAQKQISITGTLKNLFAIPRLKRIAEKFKVGNWIRARVDEEVYKLRLFSYEIDYDGSSLSSVEFSDAIKGADSVADQQKIFQKMVSMTTSYSATQRQANQGAKGNEQVNKWRENGLDSTQVKIVNGASNQTQEWDEKGMLFRGYDPVTGEYDDEQMKIVNSTIAFTRDNWKSAATAIGKLFYTDPVTGELKSTYGVNAEAIIGKIILGQSMGIYTQNGKLSFDENGFIVSNGENTVAIDPNQDSIFCIENKKEKIFSFDENGNLIIVGKIRVKDIEFDTGVKIKTDNIDTLHSVAISGNYNELSNRPSFATVATSGKYSDLSGRPNVQKTITSGNTTEAVTGSAVYQFALSTEKTGYPASSVLCTDENGTASWVTIETLKTMLGLSQEIQGT